MIKDEVMVDVVMTVYNHEKFVEKAITGILEQIAPFSIRIKIYNDCSTDGSHEIISRLIQENKSSITIDYVNQPKNLGMSENGIMAFKSCTAKYIAICEGDDYWIDPQRLQKQVSFLENHPDYNMTVGRYKFYYQNSGKFKDNVELFNISKPLTLKNYIAFNFGHTSTFLFRNNLAFPEWYYSTFAGDQSTFIINTKDKKVKYFPDFFSVYRINDGGMTSSVKASQSVKNTEKFLDVIDSYTGKKYHLLIANRKRLNKLYYYFESAGNAVTKNFIRIPIILLRWWGINVLVKFVKE